MCDQELLDKANFNEKAYFPEQPSFNAGRSFPCRLVANLLPPYLREGMLVLFDQGFQSATTFFTGVLLARSLTKTEYGIFIVCISTILIAQGVQQSLISQPCTVFAPKMPNPRRSSYFGSTVMHELAFILALTVVFAAASCAFWLTGNSDGAKITLVLCATTGAITLRPFVRFLLLSCFKYRQAFLMGSAANVLQCALVILLFVSRTLDTVTGLAVIAGTSGISSIVALALAHRKSVIRFDRRFLVEDLKLNWRFGKWGLGRTITSTLAGTAYPLALAAFLTPADTAVFGVCLGLAGVINPAILGAAAFLGPRMARKVHRVGASQLLKTTNRASLVAVALLAVYVLLLATKGQMLINLLFGVQYVGFDLLLVLVALATAIEGVACPTNAAINALEHPKVLFYSRLGASIFTLSVGILMLMKWGVIGAAVGLLMSNTITSGIRIGWIWILQKSCAVARTRAV